MTHYIKITHMWDLDDVLQGDVEIQVEPEPDEETETNAEHTALQFFDTENGDPLSGQAILNREQLEALHSAVGARLAELND